MKIQSTTSKSSLGSNKKAGSKDTTGAFKSLFSSQVSEETPLAAAQERAPQQQQDTPPKQQQPIVEDALHLLEQTMLKLDEGEHLPEQAILAIEDLRQALNNPDNALDMNQHDLQAADTLLAVEAKRLKTLNKI